MWQHPRNAYIPHRGLAEIHVRIPAHYLTARHPFLILKICFARITEKDTLVSRNYLIIGSCLRNITDALAPLVTCGLELLGAICAIILTVSPTHLLLPYS